MANFNLAIPKLLEREGGAKITETLSDKGGLTKFGISHAAYPRLNIRELTEDDARKIYKRDYWDCVRGDEINSQEIAECIFDFAVNGGVRTASKIAQIVLDIPQSDGVIGINTLAKLNAEELDPQLFVAVYKLFKIARYVDICKRDNTQLKFFFGWVSRALGGV